MEDWGKDPSVPSLRFPPKFPGGGKYRHTHLATDEPQSDRGFIVTVPT